MSKSVRIFIPALILLLVTTALTLAAGLDMGGASAARALLDPGVFVRYAVPASRTVVNVALAITVGSLVLALWALDPKSKLWGKTIDLAAGAAAVLTVAGMLATVTTFIDVSNQSFSADAQFGAALLQFITEFELGQYWFLLVLSAALTTVLCFGIRSRKLLLLPLLTAGLTLLPLAAQGHAAGASGHSLAVNAIFMHITGAAVWLGGLVAVSLIASSAKPQQLVNIVQRYSFLALWASFIVAASGVVSGVIRLSTVDDIWGTGYGRLLIAKAVTLVLAIAFGAWQRLRIINSLERAATGAVAGKQGFAAIRKTFVALVLLELAVMGAASGFAGALGRTATPQPIEVARESQREITPAEYLTGDPLPPEFTPASIFNAWKFDLLWASFSLGGIALYLFGVWRLRKRGDRWPILRTASFITGMLLLAYVTNGFLNVYEAYLFSMHMLGHMFLTMLIPTLLVLGAPVTLLLRAAAKRRDGSWGAREWVLWLTETPWAKFVTHPIVACFIFAASLWVFYFTPVLRWAMESHLGHQWMIVHFLLSGYFFTLTLIGIDPVPKRYPHTLRMVLLLVTMGAHAFFGVTIMSGTGLLAADWFGAMGRTWGADPLRDQQNGGGIAWGIGELPTLLIMLVLAWQWARSDEKEQRRRDRAAERSDEAELRAYNEMLQQRAARDAAKQARR
ncbi:cytochrome c oxidase assembly protein [Canibacter zhoujuaniae]|uniref:cytochrome c oxidase assembly protein n=2 Tax=Canibacter zhoujuaniae TaxID=2708343 RepID=UPI001AB05292|nr:cytochrome c oxidase assembly protein [Canibacter zhoujuaniae]